MKSHFLKENDVVLAEGQRQIPNLVACPDGEGRTQLWGPCGEGIALALVVLRLCVDQGIT